MYQPEQDFTGRYTLKEHLGTGGFGQVWKAYDHTVEEYVTLKIVGGGAQMTREQVRACSSEYKATLKIHHSHLLTPNYFDIDKGQMYLVMPLCEGGSLGGYLLESTLAEKDVHRLIREVGPALAYLHASRLLHNDIKPDNILLSRPLSEGGSFLLTDFGISTRLRTSTQDNSSGVKGMTHAYSAPELFGSSPKQTPATDVFSLGVMLYECCTGTVPWMGSGGVMLKNGADVPVLPDTYSPALNALVAACMAVDPARRPRAAALKPHKTVESQQAQGRKTAAKPPSPPKKQPANGRRTTAKPPNVPPPPHQKKPAYAWLLVVLFLMLGGGGYWWYEHFIEDLDNNGLRYEPYQSSTAEENDSTAQAHDITPIIEVPGSSTDSLAADSATVEEPPPESNGTQEEEKRKAAALARKKDEDKSKAAYTLRAADVKMEGGTITKYVTTQREQKSLSLRNE